MRLVLPPEESKPVVKAEVDKDLVKEGCELAAEMKVLTSSCSLRGGVSSYGDFCFATR